MWSRRDQIQAYQFVRRRTVSAVLLGDANSAQSPIRRTIAGLLAGVLCLVLLLGAFAVYGLLRPGSSTAWKKEGAIIQEKETGALFVLGTDGLLHPVLNYSSARLVTGGTDKLTRVSRKSLSTAGRGPAVGILGAPHTVPPANRLIGDPWLACSASSATAGPGQAPGLTVALGSSFSGRRINLGAGVAVVARTGRELYVLTEGRRFRVRGTSAILDVLGLTQAERVDVDPRWLSTVPSGPDLRYLEIGSLGSRSTAVPLADARVGQVFVQRLAGSAAVQYFVLLPSGLAPISALQGRLVLGDPRSAAAYPGSTPAERPLPPAVLAQSRRSPTDLDAGLYPRRPPEALTFSTGGQVVLCSLPRGFAEGSPVVDLFLAFAVPVPAGAELPGTTGSAAGGAGPPPATVLVPSGSGALVRSTPVQGVTTGPVFLVTDEGRRYVVPDAEARKALGFEGAPVQSVPAQFVDLLTTGPVLDRTAAARQVAEPARR